MAGDPTLGVETPLAGLTFWDERLNTPEPVCCADLAFAAFDINSDIIPLLMVSQCLLLSRAPLPQIDHRKEMTRGKEFSTYYVVESCVCASLSCRPHARLADACAEVFTSSSWIILSVASGRIESRSDCQYCALGQ